jgi:hypothetical protein
MLAHRRDSTYSGRHDETVDAVEQRGTRGGAAAAPVDFGIARSSFVDRSKAF